MPADTEKKCVALEKDLIIAAQRRKIDSLNDESHKLRRQRDELLQRLQRAEAKPAAAAGRRAPGGGAGREMKKSRSLSANAPSGCNSGPKASFSDFCLAEKVTASQAAASRKVCRSGMLAPDGVHHDVSYKSSSAVALHRPMTSVGTTGATAAPGRSTGLCASAAARAASCTAQPLSREVLSSVCGRATGGSRHCEQRDAQKRVASPRSSGRATTEMATEAVSSANPSQERLAAEIIQYQYRQHALNKSFERLKNRSASGRASLDGARMPPAVEPDGIDCHRERACAKSELSNAATSVVPPCDVLSSWNGSPALSRWSPAVAAGRELDEHGPTAAPATVATTGCQLWRPAGVTLCRGIDGPSALCEKELEEAETSIFEASYTSVAAATTVTGYCVPPSPYDNVSAVEQSEQCCFDAEESIAGRRICDALADRRSRRGPASADAACDAEDVRCVKQCAQDDSDAAALSHRCRCSVCHQDRANLAVVGRNGLACNSECGSSSHFSSPQRLTPRQAIAAACPSGECQHIDDGVADHCRQVAPCCDSRCHCRRSSSPTRSVAPSVASAAAIAASTVATAQVAGSSERRLGGDFANFSRPCRTVPSSPHPEAIVGCLNHAAEKERKRQYRIGLNIFNKKPEQGIEYLIERGFVDRTPRSVALFLLTRKGISKQMVGEYLGNLMQPFNQEVLRSFVSQLDFKGLELDSAMRRFTSIFRLPGEAQKIERIVEVFSQRYCHCNPLFAGQFRSADTVFVLAFSVILLNTDLHNPNIKAARRMHLEGFVNNLKGIDSGSDVDRDLLVGIYERIQQTELKPGSDHTTQVRKVEETIVEKRCAVPKLAVPYRRLVCYCRLYEVVDPSKKDRVGAHQREVFLFNDLLVITKIFSKKKNNTTYSFRGSYPLIDLKVTTFETDHYCYGIRLAVAADNRTLAFFNARNNHDREKFVDDLRESIQEMNAMENVRLDKASCRGIDDPSSAPALSPLIQQKQQAKPLPPPVSAADRHSKDSGVVVCAASGPLLLASPHQRLRSPSANVAANVSREHESDSPAVYSLAVDPHDLPSESIRELGHQQQQEHLHDEQWQLPHQYSGSDVEADMVEKRHSSGSIDSGMVSTSTGSVAEATRDEEGSSPRQPVVRASAAARATPSGCQAVSTRRDFVGQPMVVQPKQPGVDADDATSRL